MTANTRMAALLLIDREDGLDAIKEVLADRGYGILEAQIETYDGRTLCSYAVENPIRCPFLSAMGGCRLKAQNNGEDPGPDCPAVKKAAKEKEGAE